MNNETQITVKRMTSYPDRLRAYKVEVDGAAMASVRALESVLIPVSPGKHSLLLRIDWCRSPEIVFDLQPGEQINFECGSNLTGWRIILAIIYILFRRREYLWLRRV